MPRRIVAFPIGLLATPATAFLLRIVARIVWLIAAACLGLGDAAEQAEEDDAKAEGRDTHDETRIVERCETLIFCER
jgi:hypothetical protein